MTVCLSALGYEEVAGHNIVWNLPLVVLVEILN